MKNLSLGLMQSLICSCPAATALEAIPDESCFENWGQTTKLIFQRTKSSGTTQTLVVGTGVGESDVLATWTTLKAAADDTKVVVSPKLGGASFEPGEATLFGGGNETFKGESIVLRKETTKVEAMIHRAKQNVIESMKKIGCEDGAISVFLVNGQGQIAGIADDVTTPTTFRGFPITSFVVGDKKPGGREEVDSNKVQFELEEDWSDKFCIRTIADVDFNEDL